MRLLRAVLVALGAGCAAAPPDSAVPESAPASMVRASVRTIAHQILALEEEVGVPPIARERLEEFLAACEERIVPKDAAVLREMRARLEMIGAILAEHGYAFSSAGVTLLSQALERKIVDCDTASYLYLAAGERVGLPLCGALAPRHFFVRWRAPHFTLNWDVVTRQEVSDAEFAERFNVHPDAIQSGAYLKNLSRADMLSLAAALVAIELGERKRHEEAIRWFDAAISGMPALVIAYTGRARCLREKMERSLAHADLDRVLALDPGNVYARAFRAVLCMDEEKFEEGIAAATAAIRLEPTDASLYSLRAAVYKLRSAKTNSLEDLIKASEDEELAHAFAASRPSPIAILR